MILNILFNHFLPISHKGATLFEGTKEAYFLECHLNLTQEADFGAGGLRVPPMVAVASVVGQSCRNI